MIDAPAAFLDVVLPTTSTSELDLLTPILARLQPALSEDTLYRPQEVATELAPCLAAVAKGLAPSRLLADTETRIALLEALLVMTDSRESRSRLRDRGCYAVLRELDRVTPEETPEKVAIDRVVQPLLSDEADAVPQNILPPSPAISSRVASKSTADSIDALDAEPSQSSSGISDIDVDALD
eukprot:gnl/Ergobibamus_cyprinoides/456.p1 GENE.gnl/Ergobibamus_cyprinoides/456~~gnl/Ergobibamus_cyprinoides/456.p1  ORF type:complete len:182 (+),score=18.28 gnl/Ergobibamus_cyprinoides/456:360-905(+)